MTNEEYISISSEIRQLESLLADIPKESVINRWGLEKRLQSARAAIANFLPGTLAKKARLTFRGRPVFGSHGLSAEFGVKAVQFFTEAFSAVVADLSRDLHYKGPIPGKEQNQLLITGTAVGSFGFEFELPLQDSSLVQLEGGSMEIEDADAASEPAKAMAILEELFQASAHGSDDELAELVEEIHPRAVKKAADFLGFVAEHEASCGLNFEEKTFRFAGTEQMHAAAERLTPNNIREREENFVGEFQGVLPTKRNFEFRVQAGGVLRGKVGPEVDDPDVLNRRYLHKSVKVRFHVIEVGQGRPRYTLRSLADVR